MRKTLMTYKTILVHLDQSAHTANRIKYAAALAALSSGHVVGAAMTGLSRYVFADGLTSSNDPTLMHHVEFLRKYATESTHSFEKLANQEGANSIESRLIDDDAVDGMVLQARYSDLLVIGQTDPHSTVPGVFPNFPEQVVLNSARPVLIIPYANTFTKLFSHPLIAWDGSTAATRAITAALPILTQAKKVDLVVFNANDEKFVHGNEPGADVSLFLSRHGVKIQVVSHNVKTDIGQALLSVAADFGNDVIVMGGYGHSRLRETLLGGVTKTIFAAMTVPVLIAH